MEKRKLISLLLPLWGVIVAFYYYKHHIWVYFYLKYISFFDAFFIVFFVIAAGFFLYQFFFKEKYFIEIKKLTAFTTILGITVFVFFMFIMYFFENGFYKIGEKNYSVFLALKSIVLKLFPIYAYIFLIAVFAYAVGKKISKIIKLHFDNKLAEFIIASGLGFSALIYLLFVLGVLGILNTSAIWTVIVIGLVVSFVEVKEIVKDFFTYPFYFKSKFFSFKNLFLFFLIFGIGINIMALIRPYPIGWDDMGFYMNIGKLLYNYHSLVPGNQPYNWSLIMSLGFFLGKSDTLGLFLSFIAGIYAILAVYLFVKTFIGKSLGMMSVVIIYTLPMVMHISAFDMKVDMAMLYMGLLSVFLFFKWFFDEKEKKFLYLSAIFAGVSFGIKLTTFFLFFALAGTFVLGMYFIKKEKIIKVLKILIIAGIISLIPIAPWFIKNAYDSYGKSSAPFYWQLMGGYNDKTPKIDYKSIGIDENECLASDTQIREELQRYIGYETPLKRYLLIPWTITMNITSQGFYINIGFIFLALMPFLLFFLKNIYDDKKIFLLFAFTILYFIPWIFLAHGVIWYALIGVAMLAVLTEYLVFSLFKEEKFHRNLSLFLIVLSIASVLVLRIERERSAVSKKYAYGQIDKDQVRKLIMPDYKEMAELISETSKKDKKNRHYLYRVGTFLNYFIKENDRISYSDGQLEVFKCLNREGDDNLTLERFKKLGFKFALLDLFTATIEKNSSRWFAEMQIEEKTKEVLHKDNNAYDVFAEIVKNYDYSKFYQDFDYYLIIYTKWLKNKIPDLNTLNNNLKTIFKDNLVFGILPESDYMAIYSDIQKKILTNAKTKSRLGRISDKINNLKNYFAKKKEVYKEDAFVKTNSTIINAQINEIENKIIKRIDEKFKFKDKNKEKIIKHTFKKIVLSAISGSLRYKTERFVEFINTKLKLRFNNPQRGHAFAEIP